MITDDFIINNHNLLRVERHDIDIILNALKREGYQPVGPTVRDCAIIYDTLNSFEELPVGCSDSQEAGSYHLQKRKDEALFRYNLGPHSWKQFLFPSRLRLMHVEKDKEGIRFIQDKDRLQRKYAFIGVRACELNAIEIQDKVFIGETYKNPSYLEMRENTFIIAVNCSQAGKTCFCASMGTGPKVKSGFDIALTEIIEGDQHFFVANIGSERGASIMEEVPCRLAEPSEIQSADDSVGNAKTQMGREIETEGLKELLYRNYDNPHWVREEKRCLACANCTMVCPTCFCSTVEDNTDLLGIYAERWQRWDSCYTMDFSYIHNGTVRSSIKSRHRQWVVHKLATWIDQFGTSGCVGCGRCITWCPVGIDITEEVKAIRKSESSELSQLTTV